MLEFLMIWASLVGVIGAFCGALYAAVIAGTWLSDRAPRWVADGLFLLGLTLPLAFIIYATI